MDGSNPQEQLYEHLHDRYQAHYFDNTSMRYRKEFIVGSLFKGLDLDGLKVADLACGSGYNSLLLKEVYPAADTVGLDLSLPAVEEYREVVGGEAFHFDLTKRSPPPTSVDAAMVVGGLHHCVSDLDATLTNIAAMIRPGGHFMLMEPNSRYMLEGIRRIWYRFDSQTDAETEHALDHAELARTASRYFEPRRCVYIGGPAYFLILNSMMMRVPLRLKPLMAPPLFVLERLYNNLLPPLFHAVFLAQWQRNSVPVTDDP